VEGALLIGKFHVGSELKFRAFSPTRRENRTKNVFF